MAEFTFHDYASVRRKQITDTVRDLCHKRGWSHEQLATVLQHTPDHRQRIEDGQASYTLDEVEIIATLLGIDPNQFTHVDPALQTLLSTALTTQFTGQALRRHTQIALPPECGNRLVKPLFAPHQPLLVTFFTTDADEGVIVAWNSDGQLQWRYDHPTSISALAFSPDGQLLAFATENDTVVVLETDTRHMAAILDPVEQGLVDQGWWDFMNAQDPGYGLISAIAFSEDGQLAYLNEVSGTGADLERGGVDT